MRIPSLSTWTGKAVLVMGIALVALIVAIVWDAIKPPPVAATLAGRNADDFARLLRWAMLDDGTLDDVIAALHDEDAEVRARAVSLLSFIAQRRRTTRDIATLVREKALDSGEDQMVQRMALEDGIRLRVFRAPDDVARLRAVPPGPCMYWAYHALATLGDAGLASLLEILESDDAWLRENAAIALGDMRAEAKPALAALDRHLADPSRRVRIQATRAVSRIDPAFDLRGRGSHLGDGGGDAGELEEVQLLRDMNLDRDGNPLPAASGPR